MLERIADVALAQPDGGAYRCQGGKAPSVGRIVEDQQERRQDELVVGLEPGVRVSGGEEEGFIEEGRKVAWA
jgi:hypothetical protein